MQIIRRIFQPTQRRSHQRIPYVEWSIFILGLVLGMTGLAIVQSILADGVLSIAESLFPEFIGIAFTVFVLDKLDERRGNRMLREQLIRRAKSQYNPTALQAIEELRVLELLQENIFKGQDLAGADWSNASLYQADLRGLDLSHVMMFGADLRSARLQDAIVPDAVFLQMASLQKAIMPNYKRYDGRYHLSGDIEQARQRGYDIDSPEAMANYYGVSFEDYLSVLDYVESLPDSSSS